MHEKRERERENKKDKAHHEKQVYLHVESHAGDASESPERAKRHSQVASVVARCRVMQADASARVASLPHHGT